MSRLNDAAFENIVRKRTHTALNEKENAFVEAHAEDSNEELLEYLKKCAVKIGHTPNESELIGGKLITQRFGAWTRATDAAGLPRPRQAPHSEHRMIFKEEMKHQRELMRKAKEEKRKANIERMNRSKARQQTEKQERISPAIQSGSIPQSHGTG